MASGAEAMLRRGLAVPTIVVALFPAGMIYAKEKAPAAEAARSVFEELEPVLVQAPARQVEWARRWAAEQGPRTTAGDVRLAVAREFADDPPGMQAQTRTILLLILQGDIVGALQAYAVLMARDAREFNREIVAKLDEIRKARSTVIRNFARTKPPRAYAGKDPETAARAQDRSARYGQFVQVNNRLMRELPNNARQLMDALERLQRDVERSWQAYATSRDETFRARERVAQPSARPPTK